MPFTAEFVEREYNNRVRVPEHADYLARWERDSLLVREALPARLDLEYGADPRHRLDLFPASNSTRLLVFLHGGYWRSLDKRFFSWLAPSWVTAGVSVAVINYRLCPTVRIANIVEDVVAAMNWLCAPGAAHGVGTDRVVVAGHSAGGHLAAALLATPLDRFGFDINRLAGAVPISGLFDFEPLVLFSGNADFGLDRDAAQRLNLYDKSPTSDAPLVIAVGGAESSEFIRQSEQMTAAWRSQVKQLLVLPNLHHFSVLTALSEPHGPLFEGSASLF